MAPKILENCSKSKVGSAAVKIGLLLAVLLVVIVVIVEIEKLKSQLREFSGTRECQNGGTWNDLLKRCDGCRYFTYGPYCEKYIKGCKEGEELFYKGKRIKSKMLIKPSGSDEPFFVKCEIDFWGASTILVQRDDADNENFNRTWDDFKHGFGDFSRSYFVGLELMHRLTKDKDTCKVYVESKTSPLSGGAHYENFRIESEAESYSLHYDSFYGDEGIGDGFGFGTTETRMKGSPFCTFDRDCAHCARTTGSGWWFNTGCAELNLHLPRTESRNHIKWLLNNTVTPISFVHIQLLH